MGSRNWYGISSSADGSKIIAVSIGGPVYLATLDTTAPSPSFTTPTTGQTLSGTISLTATATDNDTVTGVQFKVGDTNQGSEDTTSPYTTTWDTTAISDGAYTLHAVARDPSGNYATSTISITVSNKPTVTTQTPTLASPTVATFNGTITSSGVANATEHGFVYNTSSDFSSVIATTTLGTSSGTGTFNQTRTTFTPETTYYVRAYATNSSGTSYGSTISFTTERKEERSGSSASTQTTTTAPSTPQTPTNKTSITELTTRLAELIAELNNRQPTPNDTPNLPLTFTRDLSLGMRGADVKQLQIYLNTHNFPVALTGPGSLNNETTLFGPATKSALIKFQQANNITPAVGYFGVKTRGVVNLELDF